MIKRIAKWILKMVDVDVKLDGDVVTIRIELAGVQLVEWSIDLIKEPQGVTRGKKTKG
jgi:hypothetical protein